jgi:phytanoyl-CoA hydroxylase
MQLTDVQIEEYKERGFLVLPGFASSVEAIASRMHTLVDAYQPGADATTFDTVDQKQKDDEFFLTSGNKVRFFLEEGAMVDGKLTRDKYQCINKCGHALHTDDEVFKDFCNDPRIKSIVSQLGYQKPTVIQTMFIFKPPRIGGAVLAHQDNTFLTTEPESCMAFWFAMDDANASNGCMWVAPGSHKSGITRRFALADDQKSCSFIPADAPAVPEMREEDYICCEVKKGDVLMFDGSLVHRSEKNTSDAQRNAFTMHIVDAQYPMAKECWLQRGYSALPLYN